MNFALSLNIAMADLSREQDVTLAFRAGIHFGEVVLRKSSAEHVARGAKPLEVDGLAKHVAARIMSVAGTHQILLSRAAFDLAHRAVVGTGAEHARAEWLNHGVYQLKGGG